MDYPPRWLRSPCLELTACLQEVSEEVPDVAELWPEECSREFPPHLLEDSLPEERQCFLETMVDALVASRHLA